MSAEVIQDTHVIVHATGEIDLSNIAEFRKALEDAAGKAPGGFIIDLSQATYMDSAGIQAIIAIYSEMREPKGCLVMIVGSTRIRKVIEVVRLDQLPGVCVCQTLDEAKQAVPRA